MTKTEWIDRAKLLLQERFNEEVKEMTVEKRHGSYLGLACITKNGASLIFNVDKEFSEWDTDLDIEEKITRFFSDTKNIPLDDYVKTLEKITRKSFGSTEHLTYKLFDPKVAEPYGASIDLGFGLSAVLVLDFPTFTTGVPSDLLEKWGVSLEDAFEIAKENERQNAVIYIAMDEDVTRAVPNFLVEGDRGKSGVPYLVRSTASENGANILALEDVMEGLAEFMGQSFYILPSSISEIIAIPQSIVEAGGIRGLQNMLKFGNANILPQERFLSDDLLRYDKYKKVINNLGASPEPLPELSQYEFGEPSKILS